MIQLHSRYIGEREHRGRHDDAHAHGENNDVDGGVLWQSTTLHYHCHFQRICPPSIFLELRHERQWPNKEKIPMDKKWKKGILRMKKFHTWIFKDSPHVWLSMITIEWKVAFTCRRHQPSTQKPDFKYRPETNNGMLYPIAWLFLHSKPFPVLLEIMSVVLNTCPISHSSNMAMHCRNGTECLRSYYSVSPIRYKLPGFRSMMKDM